MVHEKNYTTPREIANNPIKTSTIKKIKDAGLSIIYEQIECDNSDTAFVLERSLIEKFGRRCNGSGILANITSGGEGGKPGLTVHQYELSGEFIRTFETIKNAALQSSVTVSAIQSAANLNSSLKSAGGYLWSYEKHDQLDSHVHELHQVVTQFSKTGEEIATYSTIAEASRATGIDPGNISACCSKDLKTAGGFVWRLEGDAFTLLEHKSSVAVNQYDKKTGEFIAVFPSFKLAAQAVGCDASNISRCCAGKLKSAGGFVWKA